MTDTAVDLKWRQCVLALQVLEDLDVAATADGALVLGGPAILVPWSRVADAGGPGDPGADAARHRVGTALRLHRLIADHGRAAGGLLARHARPMALPRDHALHPGPGWRLDGVRGDLLDLGIGLSDLPGMPASTLLPVPLTPQAAAAAGVDPRAWWAALTARLERCGLSAVERLRRDAAFAPSAPPRALPGEHAGRRPAATVLRPVGGCDALTLLASRTLRAALAAADGTGLRTVAVPTRARGWFDARQVDPPYVSTVWHLTAGPDRALPFPVMITRDEVCRPQSR